MARPSRRLGVALTYLLLSSVNLSSAVGFLNDQQQPLLNPDLSPVATTSPLGGNLDFSLRHIYHHGAHRYPNLHRKLDVMPDRELMIQDENSIRTVSENQYRAQSRIMSIQRLADRSSAKLEALMEAGRARGHPMELPSSAWTIDDIVGPNITDKETVLSFARMASNAYVTEPNTGNWYDVGGGYNYTDDFGWESDGLRGHIFADTKNKTVVIGLKGTSPAVFDGDETTTGDKTNDNLFFSCCCAQGGSILWRQVCDCQTSTYTCNSTCVVKALKKKNRYYWAAQDLYHNVTARYPNADVWLTGHSLGGAVSSLLGLTYGLPVVTFGAPGEAMPAARLGLPTPPGYHLGSDIPKSSTGGYHFGHTADPIFMGTCNGGGSTCSVGGYAMESVCHTGMECVYDTVRDKGWRSNMLNHKMQVTLSVLKAYNETAKCEAVSDCTDCFNWKYFESNSSVTTTSSTKTTSSYIQTRTQTCQTPGWWGCLDESTTSKPSTTTKTETHTTTTCLTPGWFGCKDVNTTTITTILTTTASPLPSPTSTTAASTSTCRDPGMFFGCKDKTHAAPGVAGHAAPTRVLNDFERMQWGQLGL